MTPMTDEMLDAMTQEEFFQWALAEMERLDPCPVDAFEDELARRLGIERHPSLDVKEWRRLRVDLIESHPLADSVGEALTVEKLSESLRSTL